MKYILLATAASAAFVALKLPAERDIVVTQQSRTEVLTEIAIAEPDCLSDETVAHELETVPVEPACDTDLADTDGK